MQAHFDIERERSRELIKEITNDNIDGSCPFNFHSQIELYFVEKGEIKAFINDHQKILKKGHMAITMSYDAHLFRSIKDSKSSILFIPIEICNEFSEFTKGKHINNPFICDVNIVNKIKSYVNEIKEGCNDIKLRGYLYVILGIVLDNVFLTGTDSSFDTELSSELLIYLNQNFREKITLDTLADKFGYSKSYLSRFFKKNFGIGFNNYVNILRLRHYLLLMNEKKHTNTYCAFESGFDSMGTFYRVFKQEFNCSPGEYFSDSL